MPDRNRMTALVCRQPGQLELESRPRPGVPGDGEVLLGISHVGICGTDYHIYAGRQPYLSYPRIMGHEISARVLKAGKGVSLQAGSLVIVNPYVACGNCIACRRQKPNCCMAIKVLGVHTDGAMCEEIILPATNAYPAKDLKPEAAACVEFLAIGAHAVRRSMAPAGSLALVIGAGPIGLGTALFSRIAGHDVTMMDMSGDRLDMAENQFGFTSRIAAGDGAAEMVRQRTSGEGFDVVFDATGNASSMRGALMQVAHGGVLVYVGLVKDDISFPDPEFHKREAMIIASRNALKADFDHVVASISNGAVSVDRLVTHKTSLSGAVRDLPRQAEQKTGLIKALIEVTS